MAGFAEKAGKMPTLPLLHRVYPPTLLPLL